jgi:hypothetical protein
MAHLRERLDPSLSSRAFGDDEDPDGLDGIVFGFGMTLSATTQGSTGGFYGVEWIGLATSTSCLAVLPVDLDHLDPSTA